MIPFFIFILNIPLTCKLDMIQEKTISPDDFPKLEQIVKCAVKVN